MQEGNLQPDKQNDLEQTAELKSAFEPDTLQKQIFKKKGIFVISVMMLLFLLSFGGYFAHRSTFPTNKPPVIPTPPSIL